MLRRRGVVAIAMLAVVAPGVRGQAPAARAVPLTVLAGTAGAVGYTAGGASQAVLGAYGYAGFSRLLVGVQAAGAPSTSPALIYGMATLGWPARAIRTSLVYPFVGAGRGVLQATGDRGNGDQRKATAVLGAGVGVDQVMTPDGFGLLVGFRGGYLFRPGDAGERAIYFSVALGVGGQRTPEDKPPVIVAAQGTRRRTESAP